MSVENIVTINGHRVANLSAIDTAGKRVRKDHPEAVLATIYPTRIAREAHRELRDGDPQDGMHGGEFGTSFIQFVRPLLVNEEEAVKSSPPRFSSYQSNDLVGAEDIVSMPSSRHDPEPDDPGHHGDPTLASPKKGEELFDAIVANSVTFVTDLLEYRSSASE